jgi:hypothetical protein
VKVPAADGAQASAICKYDNVWWHNALFHGAADGARGRACRCESAYDTRFGGLEALRG